MAFEPMLPGKDPLEEASTAELVKDALVEARELVKLEVELAKNEVKGEVKALEHVAIGFGVAFVFALLFLAMMSVALVVALGGTAVAATVLGLVYAALAGGAAWYGYGKLPKKPLDRTRERLRTDLRQLKEHVA